VVGERRPNWSDWPERPDSTPPDAVVVELLVLGPVVEGPVVDGPVVLGPVTSCVGAGVSMAGASASYS
jgi:hypothetical protein